MSKEMVVLVDEQDNEIGEMEKMEAHEKGVLHRAFSVFLFNENNEVLLQQRAFSKYHSGGLWTNTCCSHPRKGETPLEAGSRRIQEELGIDFPVSELDHQFTFIYNRKLDKGLTEHELDHVIFGKFSGFEFDFNTDEVASVKYMSLEAIKEDMSANPDDYTEWFKICFDEVDKRASNR